MSGNMALEPIREYQQPAEALRTHPKTLERDVARKTTNAVIPALSKSSESFKQAREVTEGNPSGIDKDG